MAETEKEIDILNVIDKLSITLLNDEFDLCVCERELECKCLSHDDCVCDDDNYHIISGKTVYIGSNCHIFIKFAFNKNVILSKKKNLRFFLLKSPEQSPKRFTNEEEIPVMDLIRVYDGKKFTEKLNLISDEVWFPLFDKSSVKPEEILLKINYSLYENFDSKDPFQKDLKI
jgi:hypothetical protein